MSAFRFEDLFQDYARTVWEKDAEAHLALYASDVRLFDLWGDWALTGQTPLAQMVRGWFSDLGQERVQVSFAAPHLTYGSEMAVAEVFVRFAAIAADGQELRAMDNRFTWVAALRDGEWKIVHQHSSVPLGEEARPLFRRPD